MDALTLSDADFRGLGVCETYCGNKEKCYSSVTFSRSGGYSYATSTAHALLVYDIEQQKKLHELPNKEFGCVHIAATSHPKSVLYASNSDVASSENQGLVLLHSIHDNRILRLYSHHDKQVSSISYRPGTDQFATSADDDPGLVVWDIRQSRPVSITPFTTSEGSARCAYDPLGKVLVTARPSGAVAGFDASMLSKPFIESRHTPKDSSLGVTWTHIELSPDNKYLLGVTEEEGPMLFDGFSFTFLVYLNDHPYNACNATFSPDGRYVVTGGSDGRLYAYNISKLNPKSPDPPPPICCGGAMRTREHGNGSGGGGGAPVGEQEGTGPAHAAPVEAVAFSPSSLLLASASVELSLWQ